VAEVVEKRAEVAGVPTHWHEAKQDGVTPVLYVHGVPTASWEWVPFLERTGGVAPDLPGFGSTAKPAGFDYSMSGYDRWIEAFADSQGLDRFSLLVHDWGVVGLLFAQRYPERIERLVIANTVPLLPGYRWHWIARIWRRPLLGELFMATSSKRAFKLISRQATAMPGSVPDWFVDRLWEDFDGPTRRAILKLYRSSPPDALERAGRRLADIRCPALVVWGTRDPYLPVRFGEAYADALAGGRLERADAGHWPWLDRPELVESIASFLRGGVNEVEMKDPAQNAG
jgi:pimeloyl-ACP methyl ester carboxylesterase